MIEIIILHKDTSMWTKVSVTFLSIRNRNYTGSALIHISDKESGNETPAQKKVICVQGVS